MPTLDPCASAASALRGTPLRDRPVAGTSALPRPRRVHCQVTDPEGHVWPGLAVSWRQNPLTGAWSAWTVYVVTRRSRSRPRPGMDHRSDPESHLSLRPLSLRC